FQRPGHADLAIRRPLPGAGIEGLRQRHADAGTLPYRILALERSLVALETQAVDRRFGVAQLWRHIDAVGQLPYVPDLEVTAEGVALALLQPTDRVDPGFELHRPPGRIHIGTGRRHPCAVQAHGAAADRVHAAVIDQVLPAFGLGEHRAEAEAVGRQDLHAHLGAGVVLAQARVGQLPEVAGQVVGAHAALVIEATDPRLDARTQR